MENKKVFRTEKRICTECGCTYNAWEYSSSFLCHSCANEAQWLRLGNMSKFYDSILPIGQNASASDEAGKLPAGRLAGNTF